MEQNRASTARANLPSIKMNTYKKENVKREYGRRMGKKGAREGEGKGEGGGGAKRNGKRPGTQSRSTQQAEYKNLEELIR